MKSPDNPIRRSVPEFRNIIILGRVICPVSRVPQIRDRYISPSRGMKCMKKKHINEMNDDDENITNNPVEYCFL